jgi:hypothetical protein
MGSHLPFARNIVFWYFFADSGQHSHLQPMKFWMQLLLDLGIIKKIRDKNLDTHFCFCSKPHELSNLPIEPPKNPQLLYSTKQAK